MGDFVADLKVIEFLVMRSKGHIVSYRHGKLTRNVRTDNNGHTTRNINITCFDRLCTKLGKAEKILYVACDFFAVNFTKCGVIIYLNRLVLPLCAWDSLELGTQFVVAVTYALAVEKMMTSRRDKNLSGIKSAFFIIVD